MKKTLILLLLTFSIGFSNLAFAKALFGDRETIHKVQDIAYQDKNGQKYYLGYKTTMKMFIAGVYLSDDGYVLGAKKNYGSYIPLNQNKIENLQQLGILSKPLPSYKISLFNYILGYSLWIIIIIFVAYSFLKKKFKTDV